MTQTNTSRGSVANCAKRLTSKALGSFFRPLAAAAVALAAVPAVEAHNLDTRATSIFLDKDFVATMSVRGAASQPLIQVNDEFWVILKTTPGPGTLTGVGGYQTFYVPSGVQVTGAEIVEPDPSNPGGFRAINARGQSIIATGAGSIGAKASVKLLSTGATGGTGYSLGPNYNGVTSKTVVDSTGLARGTIAGVYADTGIFYSTDSRTVFNSYGAPTASSMVNNSGDTVGEYDAVTIAGTDILGVMTMWDSHQLRAYGRKDVIAIIDPVDQRGNAPWGLASAVAGPQSGYQWAFDYDIYSGSGTGPVGGANVAFPALPASRTAIQEAAAVQAALVTGPWNRIKYAGSQISKDTPGLSGTTLGYAGIDGGSVGYNFSTSGELPNTVNAVRFAIGMLEFGRPQYARVKVKVHQVPSVACPTMYADAFGGDAGGEQGGKDHLWRYFDPTVVSLSPCVLLQKVASTPTVAPNGTLYFDITFANNGSVALPNVTLTDTLPTGMSFLSSSPSQNTGPNPLVYNLGTVNPNEIRTVRVNVQVTTTGTLLNPVVAKSNGTTIATAYDTVLVGYQSLLSEVKTVTPSTVNPGGTVTYTLTVSNDGNAANGSPLVITEYLPSGFSYGSLVSSDLNGGNPGPGVVSVNSSNPNQPIFTITQGINAGKTLVLKFTATAGSGVTVGTYCNQVSLNFESKTVSGVPEACVTVGGASIGDTVYTDTNGNGTQDSGEPGISGVTVSLYNDVNSDGDYDAGTDTLVTTAVTDSSGYYLFTGLAAGNYVVRLASPPSGTNTGNPTGGSGNPTNQGAATVAANGSVLTVDFGYQNAAGVGSIGDQVFFDANVNGVYNAGTDTPLANITVQLYDSTGTTLLATTTTDSNGLYTFSGRTAGTYVVKVDLTDTDLPSNYASTVSGGAYASFALSGGQSITDKDFPFTQGGLNKTVNKATAVAGETLTFTLTPFQPGPSPVLANVTVTDVIPTGTTYVGSSANAGGSFSTPTITWSLGSTTAAADGGNTLTDSTTSTISHVASSTATTASGTSLVPNKPTGTAQNDVLIAGVSWNGGADRTITAPSGWNLIRTTTTSASGGASTIAQRGSATVNNRTTAGTTLAINTPTGVVAGDVMLVHLAWNNGNTATTVSLSGWTQAPTASVEYDTGGQHRRTTVLYRVAGASEPSSYTFTFGASVGQANGVIVAFSGVDSTVFDVTPGAISTGDSATPTATGFTTATANAAVVLFAASMDANAGNPANNYTSWATTSPGALTELYDYGGDSKNPVGAAWATKASAGATGNGTVTFGSSKKWGAVMLALKPGTSTIKLGEAAYYKVAGNSEPATYTWGIDSAEKWVVGISTYRGVDTTSPINADAAQANASSTSAVAPTITTTAASSMLVGIFASQNGSATASPPSSPAAMTERYDIASAAGGTSSAGLEAADVLLGAAGATGTRTATLTAATINIGHLIALKPGTTVTYNYTTVTALSANRSVVTGADTITVTLTVTATGTGLPVTVTAGSLNVTGTSGATAVFGSASPASQSVSSGSPATFTYTSTSITPGSTPGILTLKATPSDTHGSWAQGTANTIIVTPQLTFQTTVNTSPGVSVVNNTGLLKKDNGATLLYTSPTTSTTLKGSIGDTTFYDYNGNGVMDGLDSGVNDVVVTLYNDLGTVGTFEPGTDTVVGSTTTAGGGLYLFSSLAPGNYVVVAEEQTVVAPPSSTNAGLLGYMVDTTGTKMFVTLAAAQNYLSADFGFIEGALLEGTAFWDVNHNGNLEGTDTVMPNITVWLDLDNDGVLDVGEPNVVTDASGEYSFLVDPGSYVVRYSSTDTDWPSAIRAPSGDQTTPGSYAVTVTAGQEVENLNFGRDNSGRIGDTIFADLNSNGSQGSGEPGIQGVTVLLYTNPNNSAAADGDEVFVESQVTGTSGDYLFVGLADANYLVKVDTTSTSLPTTFATTPTAEKDLSFNSQTAAVVSAGGSVLDVDFGYPLAPATLYNVSGIVWNDQNNDQTQNAGGEASTFVGVTVKAEIDTDNDNVANYTLTTTTGAGGAYSFTGIPSGANVLLIVDESTLPSPGYSQTTDPDVTFDGEHQITSLSGNVTNQNFGYRGAIRVGNRIWLDNGAGGGTANDGLINGTEAGIDGVTVQVYEADSTFGTPTGSVLATATTSGGGYYAFYLDAGDYVIVIPASNFGSGQPLVNLFSSGTSNGTSNGPDPDVDTDDSDDNGYNAINPALTGVRTPPFTLSSGGEPTGETDLGSGDSLATDNSANLTVDLGFVAGAPTAVTLSSVRAFREKGTVVVEWETVTERNTVGFDVYRLEPGGARVRINASLVVAQNSETGGVYRVTDLTAANGPQLYELVELETTGNSLTYGPFAVEVREAAAAMGVRLVGDDLVIEFQGEPNAAYQLESTDDLYGGRWRLVMDVKADENGLLFWVMPAADAGSVRFFRALQR